jgi:hypothetical protein
MPQFFMHELLKKAVTPQMLLRPQGTFRIGVHALELVKERRDLFRIEDGDFTFATGVEDASFFVQRNNTIVWLRRSDIRSLKGTQTLFISWKPGVINFGISGALPKFWSRFKEAETSYDVAPLSLVDWARRNCLVPITIFSSEQQFVERVYESLALIERKLSEMHNPNVFWNFTYSGNRVLSRRPKSEKDLLPVIHAMLSDQMFLSSIDVTPEATTAVGTLDFLFSGAVEGAGILRVCVEFKNLHSADLIHGVQEQLPRYMKAKGSKFGAYCMLDYRGQWFNEPSRSSSKINTEISIAILRASLPSDGYITPYYYPVGKLQSASQA